MASIARDEIVETRSSRKPWAINRADRSNCEERVRNVTLSIEMETYIHNIITALRMHPFVVDGPGPHAYTMLEQVSKAVAGIEKEKTYVTPTDVTDVVVEVLSHQIVLSFDYSPEGSDVTSLSTEGSEPTHPRFWHPLPAARLLVGQVVHFHVPTLR
jgi:MoxR-like ATPase